CVRLGCVFSHVAMRVVCMLLYFFFSSRRRHTRSKRDWSSDVCSSDLLTGMAKNTAAAMRDLKKVYEEQVDQTQALGLEKEAEELILAGLEDQYNKNTDSLLDNLIATEELAQGVDGNISATKDLSDAEKTYLGLTNEK